MEYPIIFTILAIAISLALTFSPATAMEEKMEFELPESGQVITLSNNVTPRMMGGLDPPGTVPNRHVYDPKTLNRFEMGESGIVIDFNIRTDGASRFGLPWTAPLDRPRSGGVASAPPLFEAYEMPESGRLLIFPHQVEKRREQAIRMKPLGHAVSDKR